MVYCQDFNFEISTSCGPFLPPGAVYCCYCCFSSPTSFQCLLIATSTCTRPTNMTISSTTESIKLCMVPLSSFALSWTNPPSAGKISPYNNPNDLPSKIRPFVQQYPHSSSSPYHSADNACRIACYIPPFVQQYSADFPCLLLLTLPHPDSFTFVQQYSADFPCFLHTLISLPQPVVPYSHRTIFTKVINCALYYTTLVTTSYSRQKSPGNFTSHQHITCPTPLL